MSKYNNRIRSLRKAVGLKQVGLSNMLNVSQATLSLWENGIYEPDQKSIFLLCEIFDVTLDYLLGRVDAMEENIPVEPISFITESDPAKDFFEVALAAETEPIEIEFNNESQEKTIEQVLFEKGLKKIEINTFKNRLSKATRTQLLSVIAIMKHFK